MKPVQMPDSWNASFIAMRLFTGTTFKIHKDLVTMDMFQHVDFAIALDSGHIFKNRSGYANVDDEAERIAALDWPVLHDYGRLGAAYSIMFRENRTRQYSSGTARLASFIATGGIN